MKKVTIAIPVYNDEKYIRFAIDSAISQDYDGEIEVVVVDDSSTDNTVIIVKEIALDIEKKSNNRVIKLFINEKNMGIGFNRNECIRHATGDILMFLSSDDFFDSDYVSLIVKNFSEDTFIFSSYKTVDKNNFVFGRCGIPMGYSRPEIKVLSWTSALRNTMFCNYSTVAASLKFWNENLFDESYMRCEDLEHFLRILLIKDVSMKMIDSYKVNYRIFDEMGTNKIKNDIPEINKRTIETIRKELSKMVGL